MKVLFVLEQFAGGNPQWGPINLEGSLIEALKETGFVQQLVVFYHGPLARQVGVPYMSELLIETCASYRPDLVIFYPQGMQDIDPPRTIMSAISNTLGIKVLLVRGDSIGPEGHRFNTTWFPFVDYIAFLDSTIGHLGYGQNPKAIQGFSFNANYFYDKKLERDIDVCFVGSIPNFLRRAEYIQFLREQGINIVTRGGQRFDRLEWQEYSDIISRSKISLNFCLDGSGYSQIKGRVLETIACNTLLIEDEGIETREFFEEGKDFIMCHSKEEMLEKVNYYLKHDEERERIAESGYRKITELYNPKNMWAYMLNKVGFSVVGDMHYHKLYEKLESLRKGESIAKWNLA